MRGRYVPLFWRLAVPNAVVLTGASVVLMVQPPNGRVLALTSGLVVMVAINVVLIRRATIPLTRLTELMRRIDPLHPGRRLPRQSPESEITVLADAFNEMLDRLESERQDAGRRALSEREAERRRIAAELHDHIGQTLTALGLHADRLVARAPEDMSAELSEIRDGLLTSVDDVSALARELRPEALDTLGLVPALVNLVERMAHQTGLRINRDLDRDLPTLSGDAQLVIFRVTQEALTNAAKHALANSIDVVLQTTSDGVDLTVSDDGSGLPIRPGPGTGIRGMRERALSIGADVRIGPRDGGSGTTIALHVPSG